MLFNFDIIAMAFVAIGMLSCFILGWMIATFALISDKAVDILESQPTYRAFIKRLWRMFKGQLQMLRYRWTAKTEEL